jgi:multiple sugar transport system permease protein
MGDYMRNTSLNVRTPANELFGIRRGLLQRWMNTTLVYFVAFIAIIIALYPLTMMMLDSIKSTPDITATPPVWFFTPTLDHFHNVLQIPSFPFSTFFLNSVIVATLSTLAVLLVGLPAAYSMARNDTGGRNFDFWILSVRMLPPAAILIPLYVFFNNLQLIDTLWVLIIIYMTFNIPLCVWVLRSFIREIPYEIEESAQIDGASVWQILWRIILPLIGPGLAAVAVLSFIACWNEFFFALVFTQSSAVTLTKGTAQFVGAYETLWGEIAAATTIGMIPPLILGFAVQRYLVRGLSLGAVKG